MTLPQEIRDMLKNIGIDADEVDVQVVGIGPDGARHGGMEELVKLLQEGKQPTLKVTEESNDRETIMLSGESLRHGVKGFEELRDLYKGSEDTHSSKRVKEIAAILGYHLSQDRDFSATAETMIILFSWVISMHMRLAKVDPRSEEGREHISKICATAGKAIMTAPTKTYHGADVETVSKEKEN